MSARAKVLITRPLPQALSLKSRIEGQMPSVECLIAPSLEIKTINAELPKDGFEALIVTSINALAVIENQPFFDFFVPLFCVGQKTTEQARELGFKNIYTTAQNAQELCATIQKSKLKRFMYLRGENISFDFKQELPNIKIDEHIVYDAKMAETLPSEIITALKGEKIDIITFFSKRSVQSFLELLDQHNIPLSSLEGIKTLCISDAVLKSLSGIHKGDVYVSRTPNEDGMIETLDSICCKA
tara:strand:- start:3632 stop:4357 length:726 start_codon:yes stop_codon:yes gene_type:complete